MFQWGRELLNLFLMPILDVDAIPIALTLKQDFTFALVHKMLEEKQNHVHFCKLTPWAWTISVLTRKSNHDQKNQSRFMMETWVQPYQ